MARKQRPLILASSSPRRRQLLACTTLPFAVIEPPIHEPDHLHAGLAPAEVAESLAYFKAKAVQTRRNHDSLVLGADTVVASGDAIFGKPRDRQDAERILTALAGTRHQVITGLALLDCQSGERTLAHEVTHVEMKPMSREDMQRYLDSGAWQGKAGAYGIQEGGDVNIDKLDGSFTNVVGLPMELLEKLLSKTGMIDKLQYREPLPTLASSRAQ